MNSTMKNLKHHLFHPAETMLAGKLEGKLVEAICEFGERYVSSEGGGDASPMQLETLKRVTEAALVNVHVRLVQLGGVGS
jgi:hypothetical protein